MNIDNLNELPEWKDRGEEGEEWKTNETTEACKSLYTKWNEIMLMLNGALGTIRDIQTEDDDSFSKDIKRMLFSDAFEVGAKIRSSEAGNMYVLRMENASVIRKNAQFIQTSVLGLMMENEIDEEHGEIIREEINNFRDLFKAWVATFKKDEFTDEWGLYV